MFKTDWNDAGSLRRRLAGIHARDLMPLSMLRTERAVVRRLSALTGYSAETLRRTARKDAALIESVV